MDKIFVEIHHAKLIATRLHELEGIIKILDISDVIKKNTVERIREIKDILEDAKLKGGIQDEKTSGNNSNS